MQTIPSPVPDDDPKQDPEPPPGHWSAAIVAALLGFFAPTVSAPTWTPLLRAAAAVGVLVTAVCVLMVVWAITVA